MKTRPIASMLTKLALGGALGAAGCVGPAKALIDISSAQSELAAAKTADAPRFAPFEYTSAELYLKQAQDRLGHSGSYYQEAYEYAQKAYRFAHQAKEKAENHPKE